MARFRLPIFITRHVLFALVVGFLVWGERPDILSLLGGILIVGAAVLARRASAGAADRG